MNEKNVLDLKNFKNYYKKLSEGYFTFVTLTLYLDTSGCYRKKAVEQIEYKPKKNEKDLTLDKIFKKMSKIAKNQVLDKLELKVDSLDTAFSLNDNSTKYFLKKEDLVALLK